MRLIRLIWAFITVLIPLAGVWLAGSLAIYTGGPLWAAITAAALLFPIIPAWWEHSASARFERRVEARKAKNKPAPTRYLTRWDRLILRTLSLNLLFIAGMLAALPTQSFAALATRGDWMLSGRTGPAADSARRVLFLGAEGAEGLYELARTNPYLKYGTKADTIRPAPTPAPVPIPPTPEAKPDPAVKPDPGAQPEVKPDPGITTPTPNPVDPPTPEPEAPTMRSGEVAWPLANTLHPLVTSMPPEAERSIESVARYIKEREPDPVQRVKALHDYVADRIAYDGVALATKNFPSQEAEDVFRERKAVCAGYATLLEALGEKTGDEIIVVTGDARDTGGSVGGIGHAWNAVKINDLWYLMDATWDSGSLKGTEFTKRYSTDYLFTPPAIFISDHFPKQDDWQLLATPLSRGDFMRQPVLRPEFYVGGLQLVSPTRSQVSATGKIVVTINNPNRQRFIASLVPANGDPSAGDECDIKGVTTITITCKIKQAGPAQVWMYSTKRGNSYPFVGQIEVQGTP